MRLSLVHKLLVGSLLFVGSAGAQTVRFSTSVGAFDLVLNPTNNPALQAHVDNMLANVAAGVYSGSVVNRAAEGFVLQLGGFFSESNALAEVPFNGWESTENFDPVVVDANNDGAADFNFTAAGLSNTRGTVSLALAGGNLNSGSASFFINIGNNAASLNNQGFVPFASIPDMTVIDRIMALTNVSLASRFGQSSSNLGFTDVPLTSDGNLVLIEGVTVTTPNTVSFEQPLARALDLNFSTTPSAAAASAAVSAVGAFSASGAGSFASAHSSAAVPEPQSLVLASLFLVSAWGLRRFRQ